MLGPPLTLKNPLGVLRIVIVVAEAGVGDVVAEGVGETAGGNCTVPMSPVPRAALITRVCLSTVLTLIVFFANPSFWISISCSEADSESEE